MKKWSLLFGLLLFFSFSINAEAHPGRTDSSGGHNCTAKSVAKGLCTVYHYHNGGVLRLLKQVQVPLQALRPRFRNQCMTRKFTMIMDIRLVTLKGLSKVTKQVMIV
ncbi:MAG: YHYH domain-containing protein [Planococcus donghaensis]